MGSTLSHVSGVVTRMGFTYAKESSAPAVAGAQLSHDVLTLLSFVAGAALSAVALGSGALSHRFRSVVR